MAEIILPPEENEETPQVPELNIDKPTDNSKVITIEFEAKKTNKVSTKDTNQQLYTTDTDAWFEFRETSLEGANGTYSVVFRNRHDGSIFQRTGDVVNGVAYYKIPQQEIRHAGAWRGQVVYTLSNGDTTAREFDYDVKGHILDRKDVREIVVKDFETLMSQLRSMKDNAELELAGLVNTANQNETDRQAFFDDLVEDIDELQANYQELLDTGVLQTNINTKLEQLEEAYAPKLTEVTAQLAQTDSALNKRIDNLVVPISPENANIEVTDSHVSTVKNKTFDSLKNRLEESEKELAYLESSMDVITNEVTNSWNVNGGSITQSGYTISLAGAGTTSNVNIRQQVGKVNHKYYFKAEIRALTDRTSGIEMLYGSERIDVDWTPTEDWSTIEGIYTIQSINELYIRPHRRGGGAITEDEVIEIKNVVGLDLTAIYGVGNEPNVDAVHGFLSNFKDNFFYDKASPYDFEQMSLNSKKVPRLDASIDFTLENKLVNSRFDSVTPDGNFTRWSIASGGGNHTWFKDNGVAQITKTSEGNALSFIQSGNIIGGHKYYVSGEIKSTVPYSSNDDGFIAIAGTYGQLPLGSVTTDWTRKRTIRTRDTNYTVLMTISPTIHQPVGSTVSYDNILMIDLTEIFGEGNEPTLEEMDYLYDLIGWFEGVKTVSQSQMIKWLRNMNRELENQINDLQEHYPAIPNYVKSDIKNMNSRLAYEYGNNFKLAFMTDIHDKEEHYKYIARLMEYGYVEGLVVNGDLGKASNESSRERTMDYFLEHAKRLKNIKQNVCFTRGNHDGVVDHSFTDEDFTNAVIRPFVKENLEDKGYYYVDYPEDEIRIILLNSAMDSRSRIGFDTTQVEWFISTLNELPENWDVITISHHQLLESHGTPIPSGSDLIVDAIKGFKTNNPLSNHIGHFFGHRHQDMLDNIDGINYVCVDTSHQDPQFDGTNSEYVIDFICIDKSTRTVDLLRMGHGEDRSFTY